MRSFEDIMVTWIQVTLLFVMCAPVKSSHAPRILGEITFKKVQGLDPLKYLLHKLDDRFFYFFIFFPRAEESAILLWQAQINTRMDLWE